MLSGEKCNYFQSRVLKLLSLTSCYREQVSVQRGIYERFNGVYEQPMTEIIQHLERIGNQAKLQFAGHSLGGSLSLLVCLMLLTRKVVKPSALPPVHFWITSSILWWPKGPWPTGLGWKSCSLCGILATIQSIWYKSSSAWIVPFCSNTFLNKNVSIIGTPSHNQESRLLTLLIPKKTR